jgi:hypothetical protein
VSGRTSANLISCAGISGNCSGNSTGSYDLYISKYTSNGAWVWTQQMPSNTTAMTAVTAGQNLVTDSLGSVYIDGSTTLDLTTCGGIAANCAGTSQGSSDLFLIKYNTNGVWQWTRQLGETGTDTFTGVLAIDSSNRIYVGGYTGGDLTTCGGISANCSGASQGVYDFFLIRYDAAGTYQWSKQLGSTGGSTTLRSATTDAQGNVILTGIASSDLVSCGGISANCSGASAGTTDFFFAKYAQ